VPEVAATITGRVLSLARRSTGLSQEAFAERLAVSADTLRGWESGRRPLAATRAGRHLEVGHELAAADARPELVDALGPAGVADWLLARLTEPDRPGPHPLGRVVTTRPVHDLLAWALVGRPPAFLNGNSNGAGAAPLRPGERRQVFAELRRLADPTGTGTGSPEGMQLARQAGFLAALDPAADTGRWLAALPAPQPVAGAWSPSWAASRSWAVTAAALGDPGPLRWFIDHRLAEVDRLEQAQLAWLVYYYQPAGPPRAEGFMAAGQLPSPPGVDLLDGLAAGLAPDCGYVDLNVHALWGLLAAYPDLGRGPAAGRLAARLQVLDGAPPGLLSTRSRRELGQLAYLLAALNPKGTG
jgi:hypothetical protein